MPFREKSPVIRQMLAGVKGFRARYYERRPGSMTQLVKDGQHPEILMIGCSDSRVDPALLTMSEPGELFMVRNVANLVPPYQPDGNYHGTSAAIEYAVRVLQVSEVIVIGHSQCGGVQGLIRLRSGEEAKDDFVSPWVSIAASALDPYIDANTGDLSSGERPDGWPGVAERAVVRTSVDNLMTFPFVRERVEQRTLTLHGWWFDLGTGELWGLNTTTRLFELMD